MNRFLFFFFFIFFITTNLFAKDLPLHLLKLPTGYNIEIYAQGIPGARQLALGDKGTIFVGTMNSKVYAVVKNAEQTHIITIASGLNAPNGVAFYKGALYVSEIHRILRYDNIENHLDKPPSPHVIKDDLPGETWHGYRYIEFGPDEKLYIGLGAPCNACEPKFPLGTIMRMNPDGSNFEVFAKGVRNSMGFDWDPATKKMWFTDNGRDRMGDNIPPDKLNYAPNAGMNFGFPYWHGKGIPDPKFGSKFPESDFTMPALALPAHVAALGMKFYQGNMFPDSQKNAKAIYIAEHGSWNRSAKVGYLVYRVWVDGEKVISHEPFITGWLQGQSNWGRPVDVLNLKDGSLLISDDHANVIYRVTYKK